MHTELVALVHVTLEQPVTAVQVAHTLPLTYLPAAQVSAVLHDEPDQPVAQVQVAVVAPAATAQVPWPEHTVVTPLLVAVPGHAAHVPVEVSA